MRKFFTHSLAAVMTVLFASTVSAKQLYVIGDGVFDGWTPENPVPMTLDNDGITNTMNVSLSGPCWWAVCDGANSNWDTFNSTYRYGVQTGDYDVTIGEYQLTQCNGSLKLGAGDYTISVNSETMMLTISGQEEEVTIEKMTIVGALFGGWDFDDNGFELTKDTENENIWTGTTTKEIAAGEYDYKVSANHTWGVFESPQSGNKKYTFSKSGTYKLTFTVNTEDNNSLNMDVEEVFDGKYYFITSNGENNWCLNEEYTESDPFIIDKESGTITGDYFFALAPSTCLKADLSQGDALTNTNFSWQGVIRPVAQSDRYAIDNFQLYDDDITTDGSAVWYVRSDLESKIAVYANFYEENDPDGLGIFSILQTVNTNIGAAGYATYSSQYDINIYPDGWKAYIVTNNGSSSVTLEEISGDIPANTGILLEGSGEVEFNNIYEEPQTIATNYLVGTGNASLSTIPAGSYIFSWDGSDPSTVGFYPWGSGTLAPHKAYLAATAAANNAPFLALNNNGEATGISEAVAVNTKADIFNMQGMRLSKLQKGLNIMNGKKVIVK